MGAVAMHLRGYRDGLLPKSGQNAPGTSLRSTWEIHDRE